MKTLLIVDLQKGFLNDNCNFVVEKIEKLVKKGNFDRIVATKFVNSKNSQYQKFLNYGKFCSKTETDLALKLPKDAQIVEKTSYALRGGILTRFSQTRMNKFLFAVWTMMPVCWQQVFKFSTTKCSHTF